MARKLKELMKKVDPKILAEAKLKSEEIILELRIKELREHLSTTQNELASRMGIKQPTLAKMESAEDPKLKTLKKYAMALGFDSIELNFKNSENHDLDFNLTL